MEGMVKKRWMAIIIVVVVVILGLFIYTRLSNKGVERDMNMIVMIGDKRFEATLQDNKATDELIQMMEQGPVELSLQDYSGFEKIHQDIITQKHLVEDCMALLDMTPYRYKSSKEAVERVSQLKTAEITFEFVITVWRKL